VHDDDPIPPDQLQAILARALASDHAEEIVPAGPSYARVLCPGVAVVDVRRDEGRWDSVRVLLHDASDGGREFLGALMDHRSCGPYDVRIAYDRRPDPSDPDVDEEIWEVVVSRKGGLDAAVLSYFRDQGGAWRRFRAATEERLAEAMAGDAPCSGFW
jgi:hypothetical protein